MDQLTIKEFSERYLLEIKPLFKSHYSMTSVMRNFAETQPEKKLTTLTPPDVYQYTQKRLQAGIKTGTINRELSVISAAINHAIRKWGIQL